MINFDDLLKDLENLQDELSGVGDVANADTVAKAIRLLEESEEIHIAKPVFNEGDCLRCPHCGKIVYSWDGRCYECGQKLLTH